MMRPRRKLRKNEMKKILNRHTLLLVVLLAHSQVHAAEPKAKAAAPKQAAVERSVIRVLCEDKTANSEVSVNGVLKGECPLDMEVRPGLIEIRAVKKRDEYYDQVFEQSFTLGAGVAKRIDIAFNKRAQFRPQAIARIDKLIEPGELAQESKRRAEMPALETAAAGGDGAAMARLAMFYRQGLAGAVDMKKSVDWCRKGAEAGNPECMYEYARLLEKGYLVPKNMAAAIELYQKAAALDEPRSLEKVGRFFEAGSNGFQKNPRQAMAYFMKAAEGGDKLASLMYWGTLPEAEKDAGLATQEKLDIAAARIQLRKAEAGEDFDALTDAAGIYTYGVYGNAKNPERALTYYRMALRQIKKKAAAGDAESNYLLGYWFEVGGISLPVDKAEALRYYKKAQQLGYPDATEALNKLQSE
jgi:TPR repeat protein